jgi:hypothetical protein
MVRVLDCRINGVGPDAPCLRLAIHAELEPKGREVDGQVEAAGAAERGALGARRAARDGRVEHVVVGPGEVHVV